MIPEHYLHILLGTMPGYALGFLTSYFLARRRMRRISAKEWAAARKFYIQYPTN